MERTTDSENAQNSLSAASAVRGGLAAGVAVQWMAAAKVHILVELME